MNDNGSTDALAACPSIVDDAIASDMFLRDVDMLNAFRAIKNETVRRSIRDLVVKIASQERAKQHGL